MSINQKYIYFLAIIVGLSIISPIVQATYVPPPDQEKVSDYSKSTGVRTGFGKQSTTLSIILLAPQTYVGYTSSIRPDFIWILEDNNLEKKINFRLFEFDNKGNIKQRGKPLRINSSDKLVILSFPQNQSSLHIGKKYLWQVAIQQPEGNWIIQKAEFRVVPISLDFRQSLVRLQDRKQRIKKYAENGFWYDALAESFKLSKTQELGKIGKELVQDLVESEMQYLSDSLSPEEYRFIETKINLLKAISLY